MAGKPIFGEKQDKSPENDDILSLEDEYPDFDDKDDELDGDIDYFEKLGDLELKDLDAESLAFLNTVIFGNGAESGQPDDIPAKESDDSKALVPTDAPEEGVAQEEGDIDSEEERDLLKGIRDEVEDKVREEMKDEIQNYRSRMKALEAGEMSGKTDDEKNETDGAENMEDMDPELREAIIKMNKLDRILRKKVRKEKEVKRDRLLLQSRIRQEISEIAQGSVLSHEIRLNTEKYLALAPPPSHNEGITVDKKEEEEEDLPPLFQTQIDDSEVLRQRQNTASASGDHSQGQGRPESTVSSQGKSSRAGSRKSRVGGKGAKYKKDFIKRNKELAADADQAVAMTDDEKKRLAELLDGVDELPELDSSAFDDSLSASSSFQVTVHPGEGFCPDNVEFTSLTNIDEKLKSIMPEEDYNSIILPSAASYKPSSQQALFTRVGMQLDSTDLPERFGERVLYETKEDRELQARLQAIEDELKNFKASDGMEDEVNPQIQLTDEELDKLLDQCARNLYRPVDLETPDLSARSSVLSRHSLMENPPKLSDKQLQQLLSEAHFPLSSTLLALRDDEKMLEEEGCTEAIRAETWKAIKDADPDNDMIEFASSNTKSKHDLYNPPMSSDPIMDEASVILNKNMSANSASTPDENDASGIVGHENSRESGDHVAKSSVASLSSVISSQSIHSETSASGGLSETSGGLPRISQTNGISKSDSYHENTRSSVTPTYMSRENSDTTGDSVRLPTISAKSFLIHAPQGMNNKENKDKNTLPSRQPLEMVRNNLSDMRVNSFSEEESMEGRNQVQIRRSSGMMANGAQPKPPTNKDQSKP